MVDYTGKNAEGLKEKTLYLLDMDGTIYNENEILRERWICFGKLRKEADSMCLLPIILQNRWRII